MKLVTWIFVLLVVACNSPEPELLSEYEAKQVAHEIWEFQIYPESTYLEQVTSAYERAHMLMNPTDDEPPRMAVYETDDSIDEVGRFYAEKYGYGEMQPNEVNDFSPFAPPAYFSTGSLRESTEQILPLLEQLEFSTDIADVGGEFRSGHISGIGRYPRVTLQRPWYDFTSGEVKDTTMILMVLELSE